ncbi:MAG: hypothetical protein ACRENE_07890 [Polyangiaceae bacterium]
MNRKSFAVIGVLGLSCSALAFQACSSSSSGSPGDDGGSDAALDQTSSSSSGGSSGTSSGASSGSSSGASSGGSSGSSSGGADATCAAFDAGAIDPNLADAGMQLVLSLRCYSCHQSNALDAGGLTLSGRLTSLSDAAPVFPPNLTPDPATGLGCWNNQQIATALLDGIDNEDAGLCVMPKFRAKFADAGLDIDASTGEIIEFLRSLPAVSHQVPDTVCAAPSTSDAGEGGASSDASDGGSSGEGGPDASEAGSSVDASDAGSEASDN